MTEQADDTPVIFSPREIAFRRANARAKAERTLKEAVEAAATPEPEPELPLKEAAKRAKAEEKRERMLRQADAARASSLRSAGLEADERTAAGQREIVVSNARGASGKRGSLAEYGVLIRNQSDRTGPRIAAMRQFDELCHRAFAGLLPEPRFEPGVDTSAGPAGVTEARIAGLSEMQNLTRRIGDEAQALMYARVYERRTFTWMADQGFGSQGFREERGLAVLFLSAVDGVARFYGLTDRSKAVDFMESRLGNAGL
jgi:hypothetical protein